MNIFPQRRKGAKKSNQKNNLFFFAPLRLCGKYSLVVSSLFTQWLRQTLEIALELTPVVNVGYSGPQQAALP
jgi:hypothetical protein